LDAVDLAAGRDLDRDRDRTAGQRAGAARRHAAVHLAHARGDGRPIEALGQARRTRAALAVALVEQPLAAAPLRLVARTARGRARRELTRDLVHAGVPRALGAGLAIPGLPAVPGLLAVTHAPGALARAPLAPRRRPLAPRRTALRRRLLA